MTNHPSECFIKYLISADPQATAGSIQAVTSLYGLPPVEESYITALTKAMGDIPETEKLVKPDQKSLRWMRRHQISQLWLDEEVRKGISAVLGNARVRSLVEKMVIAGYKPSEIESFLTGATARDIQHYVHYVFDLDRLLPAELEEFLKWHSPLSRSLWVNRGEDSKRFLLHQEGIAPIEATVEVVGSRIIKLVNDRIFRMSVGAPSELDSKVLRNYATALSRAALVIGSGADAASEFKKIIDRITLTPEDDGIITFEQLRQSDSDSDGGQGDDDDVDVDETRAGYSEGDDGQAP